MQAVSAELFGECLPRHEPRQSFEVKLATWHDSAPGQPLRLA